MGRPNAVVSPDPTIARFAARLRQEIGAERVLLFGSQATGRARPDSDFDLIIVADRFRRVSKFERHIGLRQLYYDVGGEASLDLFCLTPEEFDWASTHITLVNAVLPEAIDLLTNEAAATDN